MNNFKELYNGNLVSSQVFSNPVYKNERITSIDALRGITLFFILLIHSTAYFGYANQHINDMSFMTGLGHNIAAGINWLFEGRANKVFEMLFGVSFYLILKNPSYPSIKFVWRCVLLAIIGLFNLLFYTGDTLLWYGIWGCFLTLFRNCSVKTLFILFGCIFVTSFFTPQFAIGNIAAFTTRYSTNNSILDVMKYPLIYGYSSFFSNIPLRELAYFILGYGIAKSGVLENLPKHASRKNILYFLSLYIVFFTLWIVYMDSTLNVKFLFFKTFRDLFGAFFYILLFLKIYYAFTRQLSTLFSGLQAYGRLGLTNYSFQGILGVILSSYVIMRLRFSFEFAIVFYLLLYTAQVFFSYLWLKSHKYGPMEWLWRCLTSRKFTSNRIDLKQ